VQDQDNEQLIDELSRMRSKVAELEAALKALNEPESKYREMIDGVSEAVFVIQDGWIKFANHVSSELNGYSKEEVLATNAIAAFVHPDDQEMLAQYHARRLQGDKTPFNEVTYPILFNSRRRRKMPCPVFSIPLLSSP
jgi:PAS domain S-box-containing protein